VRFTVVGPRIRGIRGRIRAEITRSSAAGTSFPSGSPWEKSTRTGRSSAILSSTHSR
jgi:hypothetical protein